MRLPRSCTPARLLAVGLSILIGLTCAACGTSEAGIPPSSSQSTQATSTSISSTTSTTSTTTSSSTTTASLPGTGKPQVTIGDKNYTEQFVLGELYSQALRAQGFSVQLNQNIGPTAVTMQALKSGSLAMYPEYLNVFNTAVASDSEAFHSRHDAYRAAQGYALSHGLELANPTPFSDTAAVGVTVGYAQTNNLNTLDDLGRVASSMTLGGPAESDPSSPSLTSVEQDYGFTPKAYTALAIGAQYTALDDGSVQAAEVQTTDGQLLSGDYKLLADPQNAFGWGNVVPVISSAALNAEGPVFRQTIDDVSAQLNMYAMRALNEAVDIAGQSPATVAHQFLETHGLIPASS